MSVVSRRLPVTLLTGFLGSGKTTLLNAALHDPAMAGTLVIVNEFGETGLDHLLVGSAEDQVLLLDSGCLCCAASGNLRDTLIDIFARRSSGAIEPFERIVVETSGLAHPGPLVATLLDSALAQRCALSHVVTLVDAANGPDTLRSYDEARQQVALADQMLVSKSDSADAAGIATLEDDLRGLNPHASLARWHQGMAGPTPLAPLATSREPANTVLAQPDIWLANLMNARRLAKSTPGISGLRTRTHSAEFQNIHTHTLHLGQAVLDWPGYARLTQSMSRAFGRKLLRCKGILNFDDGSSRVIQGVQGFFSAPQALPNRPDCHDESFLVCIGDGLSAQTLEAIAGEALELTVSAHLPTDTHNDNN